MGSDGSSPSAGGRAAPRAPAPTGGTGGASRTAGHASPSLQVCQAPAVSGPGLPPAFLLEMIQLPWQPQTSLPPASPPRFTASKVGPSAHSSLRCPSTHGSHVHSGPGPAGSGPRRPELQGQPLKAADLALGQLPAFTQAGSLARWPSPSLLIRQKQAGWVRLGWAGKGRGAAPHCPPSSEAPQVPSLLQLLWP